MLEQVTHFLPNKKLARTLLVCLVLVNMSVLFLYVDHFEKSSFLARLYMSTRSVQQTYSTVTGSMVQTGPLSQDPESSCVVDRSTLRTSLRPGEVLEELELDPGPLHRVSPGGAYTPPNCTATSIVAVIVPFRDREEHRLIFLRYMHAFLQKQQIQYRLYLIEMTHDSQFNRALLLNAGFVHAADVTNYTCFVFHDVDLLPTNEFNFYNCSHVTHLSTNNSKYGYKLPYSSYIGGVVAFPENQFRKINGFSNLYFGWGNEDDDLGIRIRAHVPGAYKKRSFTIGKYEALMHEKAADDQNNRVKRHDLIVSSKARAAIDGLNTLDVKTIAVENRPLYTRVLIEANEKAIIDRYLSCVKTSNCLLNNNVTVKWKAPPIPPPKPLKRSRRIYKKRSTIL